MWLGLIPVVYVDHSSGAPVAYYVLADQVGEPQKLTDSTGALVWDRRATPFGEEVSVTGALIQPLRFPGQRHDAETLLADNWHRTYDPSLGRYVQSDPIGLAGGINTYGYAYGNPVSYVDPTGEIPPPLAGALLGAESDLALQLVRNDFQLQCVNWWEVAGAGVLGAVGGRWFQTGKELKLGKDLRIAPFGNRTGDPYGKFPHYHRRGPKGPDGKTREGQGIGRHRPFEPSGHDRSFGDRF